MDVAEQNLSRKAARAMFPLLGLSAAGVSLAGRCRQLGCVSPHPVLIIYWDLDEIVAVRHA
jgi:hypothetical protein